VIPVSRAGARESVWSPRGTAPRLMAIGAAAVTAWGLKRHYADAGPDDLLWILSPTTWLVGVATGANFTFQPEEGYLSREHMFLIEKTCAGINFMIAAFGMLVYTLFHHVKSARRAAQVLGLSLLAGYSAAVVVNAGRIAAAMWLAAHPAAWSPFTAADVHRVEGIVVYFGGLVLLYELVQLFDRRAIARHSIHWTAVPLAAYYAVTLALPLANGAAQSGGAFVRHALVVLAVPPILVVLGWAAYGVARSHICKYASAPSARSSTISCPAMCLRSSIQSTNNP
jgi:exosortase K